jgi:arginase
MGCAPVPSSCDRREWRARRSSSISQLASLRSAATARSILIAYLNQRYGGKIGVLWVDAHPDVMTPRDHPNPHAHVLGALLGMGDPDLTGEVEIPLTPS